MGFGDFLLGAAAYKLFIADSDKASEARLREAKKTKWMLRGLEHDTKALDTPGNPVEKRPRILFPDG